MTYQRQRLSGVSSIGSIPSLGSPPSCRAAPPGWIGAPVTGQQRIRRSNVLSARRCGIGTDRRQHRSGTPACWRGSPISSSPSPVVRGRRLGEAGDGGRRRGAARPGAGRREAKTLTRCIPFGPHLLPFRTLKCETILSWPVPYGYSARWRKQDRGSRRQPAARAAQFRSYRGAS